MLFTSKIKVGKALQEGGEQALSEENKKISLLRTLVGC